MVLFELKDKFQSVTVLAYLNNVFLVGLQNKVLSSLEVLKSAFSSIGLQISTNKCEVYSPSGYLKSSRSVSNEISEFSDDTIIHGAPIGNNQYVSNVCCQ